MLQCQRENERKQKYGTIRRYPPFIYTHTHTHVIMHQHAKHRKRKDNDQRKLSEEFIFGATQSRIRQKYFDKNEQKLASAEYAKNGVSDPSTRQIEIHSSGPSCCHPQTVQAIKDTNVEEKELSECLPYQPSIKQFTKINPSLSDEIAQFISTFKQKQQNLEQFQSEINEQRLMLNEIKSILVDIAPSTNSFI